MDIIATLKPKAMAFLYHFAISIVVLSCVFFLVKWIWYPGFMYQLDGAWEGSKVVLLVDLVLGPALTFMVYKKGKKGLRFDLTLIGVLQISAMLYGVHLLYAYRPVVLILSGNEFISVTADVYENYAKELPPRSELDSEKLCGFSCYRLSNSVEAVQSVVEAGVPARVLYHFYLDYAGSWDPDIGAVSLDDKTRFTDQNKQFMAAQRSRVAENFEMDESQLLLLPARGRYTDGFVFVEKANGKILDFVLRPSTVEDLDKPEDASKS